MRNPLSTLSYLKPLLLCCVCISSFFLSLSSLAQSSPEKLNANLTNEGDVIEYLLSPDSNYAVYLADQISNGTNELFSVPIDLSSVPVRLNNNITSQGNVTENFQISPDSNYVVYLADQDNDDVFELFSAPIDGSSAAVKLNGNLATNGDVLSMFKISPDSSRVVYQADQNNNDVFELFSVPIDGSGSAIKLNDNLVGSGDVMGDFKISSDSSHVVYLADQITDQVNELFSVPIDGSASSTRLNTPLSGSRDVFPIFAISPDGNQVSYVADRNSDDVFELFSVPITGGIAIQINTTLVSGGDILDFKYSPDNNYIVYLADKNTDETRELFSVLLSNRVQQVRLNSDLVSNGDVFSDYQITSNSSRVIYTADQFTDNRTELFSVPIAGGTANRLNGSLPADGDVKNYQLSADGAYVVYRADQRVNDLEELFSVSSQGGFAVRLNTNLVNRGDVNSTFLISPDNTQVVYGADQLSNDVNELFRVPIRATADPERLNDTLPNLADITEFKVTADGTNIIYLGDQDTNDTFELYTVSIATPQEPRPMDDDFCVPVKAQNGAIIVICL